MTLEWVEPETLNRIAVTSGKSIAVLKVDISARRDEGPIALCKWLQRECGLTYADAKTLVAIVCDEAKGETDTVTIGWKV